MTDQKKAAECKEVDTFLQNIVEHVPPELTFAQIEYLFCRLMHCYGLDSGDAMFICLSSAQNYADALQSIHKESLQ